MRLGVYGLALLVLAVLGAMLAIRDPRSWSATLLVASYSGLFLLVMPFFDRYRTPVEPTIVLLATIPLALGRSGSWPRIAAASLRPLKTLATRGRNLATAHFRNDCDDR